jgi:hypothetical protein
MDYGLWTLDAIEFLGSPMLIIYRGQGPIEMIML